jgi:hypothetical protein
MPHFNAAEQQPQEQMLREVITVTLLSVIGRDPSVGDPEPILELFKQVRHA